MFCTAGVMHYWTIRPFRGGRPARTGNFLPQRTPLRNVFDTTHRAAPDPALLSTAWSRPQKRISWIRTVTCWGCWRMLLSWHRNMNSGPKIWPRLMRRMNVRPLEIQIPASSVHSGTAGICIRGRLWRLQRSRHITLNLTVFWSQEVLGIYNTKNIEMADNLIDYLPSGMDYLWLIRAVWTERFTYGSVRAFGWKSHWLLDWKEPQVATYSIFRSALTRNSVFATSISDEK